ncbi:bifunctional adenosylcobinamide kinase/adenosylcobinamide-phosphate guanylyltransferase [Mycobacterium sp. CVI_P3]|uniref:Adenosylcobinamide kinase n=1 Tax=Mycobacterium pinniadriaticum TaxID=2994102 RepID=A0ABT3SJL5_9MYCO|nr:bifunctional adenosylcobinamide kinase/adenosylcobinamide-phosphate guanylyltransferase [Mycobacterium pinniadriaticum]MCX2933299.1 bifunctional adenosylcobinamide kinase/adenosylcobinamide-phosphate guanylyltransferase [Mycobacterium pinniadriaticum]MCX2939721.1 bifunctional adenosylcobinamide kinase/adenosylcobinamide-phosphate guanylyltransferase [Mycobacterium pinniadriaticum]
MRTLVLGGIRSGKSRWAEEIMAGDSSVRYVATGAGADADPSWAQRVAEHRSRRPGSWNTAETADVACLLRDDAHTATLVDDLGGWLTAALDRRGWDCGSVASDVDELVRAVEGFAAPLVLVSPEVGLTVVSATASGRRFTDELGTLNQRLARCCEQVVLVVAGLPVWVKPTKAFT